ncbi:MAG: GTPase [Thermoplasmata archaeon]|jgi:GTP-binding protein HflX|nr:GTPase [Thermoplasmata archaeon]
MSEQDRWGALPGRRKALLLTSRPDTAEMEELVFALGVDLAGTVIQRRPQPDPSLFLGSGKIEEAAQAFVGLGADLVVVNAALKPSQIFNLQQAFTDEVRSRTRERGRERPNRSSAGSRDPDLERVEVYDRTRLILEIFRERARSPEARLQVELATLQYEMPLVKEAINLEKRGERQAAMFGGGQYGVNEYHDTMKRRMVKIRRELERMRRERDLRRKHRRRGGFHLVSLAGYTNAGKSSLLRALSDRETLVENRYFSTLSTKTSRAQSEKREILVTDTVGFIEDLPPWMVEAFHSTLEEIAMADVILLVLDASDPVDEMTRRLRSSLRILYEFELAPVLVALNKVDKVDPAALAQKEDALRGLGLLDPALTVRVSARDRVGLDAIYEKLYALIPDYDEYEVALPATSSSESLIAWIHDHADVLDLTRGGELRLRFEVKRSLRATLVEKIREVGGGALREVQRTGPANAREP